MRDEAAGRRADPGSRGASERSDQASQVPPWWHGERAPRSDDREPLTRERIVRAALALVDRDGLDALSMRHLGDELGAGTTSVYWHVPNKDALLDLLLDEILGEVVEELPEGEDWLETLRSAAAGLRRVLLRHRNAAPLVGERMPIGPKALAGVEWLLGRAIAAGLPPRDALLTISTVVNFASGWAAFECRTSATAEASGRSQDELDALIVERMLSLPAERFPAIVAAVGMAGDLTPDDRFSYGLELLLRGIRDARPGAMP
jgi:AcrR family transcriptional regulator